jgi:hypothetical protein
MSEWGTGKVTGGKLYCRKKPEAGYAAWGRFANNVTIPIKVYDDTWYETYWNGNTSNVGYVMKQYITNENWDSGSSGSTGSDGKGSLSVSEYISNLESFCNSGWKYGSGYNASKKTIDCAYYPYKARNELGAHGCTTEYNSYLSEKGTISSLGGYDALQVGMEVFQQDTTDTSKKGHMGVYAGKQVLNGTLQHTVYQSCSSHNTVDAKYNHGVSTDSGPNLTGMNSKWKYWGWSKYITH